MLELFEGKLPDRFQQEVNFTAFTQDGVLVNSDAEGLAVIGAWEKITGRRFAITFQGFYPLEGQKLQVKVVSRILLNTDREIFDGPYTASIYDARGNQVASVSGLVHAERMQTETLPLSLDLK